MKASVCWNDGSVKIVAGPSDHQGKGFSRTDNNTILLVRVRGPALILKTGFGTLFLLLSDNSWDQLMLFVLLYPTQNKSYVMLLRKI